MTDPLDFARTRGHFTLHHVLTTSYTRCTVTSLTLHQFCR